MDLKKLGFPNKIYPNDNQNKLIQSSYATYMDYIIEGNDDYFIAEKEKVSKGYKGTLPKVYERENEEVYLDSLGIQNFTDTIEDKISINKEDEELEEEISYTSIHRYMESKTSYLLYRRISLMRSLPLTGENESFFKKQKSVKDIPDQKQLEELNRNDEIYIHYEAMIEEATKSKDYYMYNHSMQLEMYETLKTLLKSRDSARILEFIDTYEKTNTNAKRQVDIIGISNEDSTRRIRVTVGKEPELDGSISETTSAYVLPKYNPISKKNVLTELGLKDLSVDNGGQEIKQQVLSKIKRK